MLAGNHPDYHVVTKELIRFHDKSGTSKGIDLSIKVIRPEVIDVANRKAAMGRGKVFVIEQAELMNAQAQNSLLKTLEEPAGRTLIILLTDQPGALLPTIRSRCQLVRFAALDEATGAARAGEAQGREASGRRRGAVRGGSLGVALRWLEDGVVDAAGQLTEKIELIIAGRSPGDVADWFKKSAEAYAEKQLERDELASKDQANREGPGDLPVSRRPAVPQASHRAG
jgi:DNA polymerase III delta prime subunit